MKQKPISLGGVYKHAEYLAKSHSALICMDPEDDDDDLVGNDSIGAMGATFEAGHYKEGDFAIWSIVRIINDQKEGIIAARLNRVSGIGILNGFLVDVVAVTKDLESQMLEVGSMGNIQVRLNLLDFGSEEFSLTMKAIFDNHRPDEMAAVESSTPEADTCNPPTLSSEIGFSADLTDDMESPVVRNLLNALAGLEIDQRYVSRSMSEREALDGREATKELLTTLDNLYAKLTGGGIRLAKKIESNLSEGVEHDIWVMQLPTGDVLAIKRYPISNSEDWATERETEIARKVVPPSVLANAIIDRGYDYVLEIRSITTTERRILNVNSKKLTVETASIDPLDTITQNENSGGDAFGNLRDLMRIKYSTLVSSAKFLDGKEVAGINELLQDTSCILDTVQFVLSLSNIEGRNELLAALRSSNVDRPEVARILKRYTTLPEWIGVALRVVLR